MVQALAEGHAVIKQIVALQKELQKPAGKQKRTVAKKELDPGFVTWAEERDGGPAARGHAHDGQARVLRRA